jgi:hypothetical protein
MESHRSWGPSIEAEDVDNKNALWVEEQHVNHALQTFRDRVHAAAERPDAFWERQRQAVSRKIDRTLSAQRPRPAWAFVSAAVIIALGLALFLERKEPVTPDFAAGHDQELLIKIERSLRKELPEALEPVLLLTAELDTAANRSHPK